MRVLLLFHAKVPAALSPLSLVNENASSTLASFIGWLKLMRTGSVRLLSLLSGSGSMAVTIGISVVNDHVNGSMGVPSALCRSSTLMR